MPLLQRVKLLRTLPCLIRTSPSHTASALKVTASAPLLQPLMWQAMLWCQDDFSRLQHLWCGLLASTGTFLRRKSGKSGLVLGGTEYGVVVQTICRRLEKDADGWFWWDLSEMGAIHLIFIANPKAWHCAKLTIRPPRNGAGIRVGSHGKEASLSNTRNVYARKCVLSTDDQFLLFPSALTGLTVLLSLSPTDVCDYSRYAPPANSPTPPSPFIPIMKGALCSASRSFRLLPQTLSPNP